MSGHGGAFFDVDGTLVKANIIHYLAFLQAQSLSPLARGLWYTRLVARTPYFWLLDKIDRGLFNERFYRSYRGWEKQKLEQACQRLWEEFMRPRLYPAGLKEIQFHQDARRPVVLVSGSLAEIIRPLAEEVNAAAAFGAQMKVEKGRLTGMLEQGPMTGRRKGQVIDECIETLQLDRQFCYAYADSADDRFLLERVGHPHAVNPQRRLRRLALANDWKVLEWKLSST